MKASEKALRNTTRQVCFCRNCLERYPLYSNEYRNLIERHIKRCEKCGHDAIYMNTWLTPYELEQILNFYYGEKLV